MVSPSPHHVIIPLSLSEPACLSHWSLPPQLLQSLSILYTMSDKVCSGVEKMKDNLGMS